MTPWGNGSCAWRRATRRGQTSADYVRKLDELETGLKDPNVLQPELIWRLLNDVKWERRIDVGGSPPGLPMPQSVSSRRTRLTPCCVTR